MIPIIVGHIDSVYQEKTKTIDNMYRNAITANQEFTSSIDKKLEQYSQRLSDSANHVME